MPNSLWGGGNIPYNSVVYPPLEPRFKVIHYIEGKLSFLTFPNERMESMVVVFPLVLVQFSVDIKFFDCCDEHWAISTISCVWHNFVTSLGVLGIS